MSKYTNLLSEEIKEKIEEYMIEKNLQPHDRLPSERFFSQMFGVNRQTVRTALKRLKNEHHLYTLPGKGNFVSPPKYKEETELLASFSEGWKSEGKTSSKVIEFSLIDASLSVSTNLQIEFGEKVYKLERARCINDEYITIEISFIPEKYCKDLHRFDFSKDSLYDVLENIYGYHLSYIEEKIAITALKEEDAELLGCETGADAFYIKGFTFDDKKRIIEYCITSDRADRFVLVSQLETLT